MAGIAGVFFGAQQGSLGATDVLMEQGLPVLLLAVIGGITSDSLHPYYYLTSPAVDVSAAPGQVYLEFWRWLNSDYTPFMNNTNPL